MLLAGEKSIREVIAFAKTTAAVDLMAESPSEVDAAQLDQLGIGVLNVKEVACQWCGGAWRIAFEKLSEPGHGPHGISCPSGRGVEHFPMIDTSGIWSVKHRLPGNSDWLQIEPRRTA